MKCQALEGSFCRKKWVLIQGRVSLEAAGQWRFEPAVRKVGSEFRFRSVVLRSRRLGPQEKFQKKHRRKRKNTRNGTRLVRVHPRTWRSPGEYHLSDHDGNREKGFPDRASMTAPAIYRSRVRNDFVKEHLALVQDQVYVRP